MKIDLNRLENATKKMSKKKHKQKVEFKPFNNEQALAIVAMQDFVNNGDPQSWFVLKGKAGTGKTTIAQEAAAPFISRKVIIIMALAHKAKLILLKKMDDRFGPGAVQGETIASALGMGMDPETGKFSTAFGGLPNCLKH